MIVLLDNGHGENTAGKRSPDGRLREYLYTREIAQRVAYELRKQGIQTRLIVTEDIDVPLHERVRRVNAECRREGAKNCLLVSIHVNASGCGAEWREARGWSAYTTKGRTRADQLATEIYNEAERKWGEQSCTKRKIRKDLTDGDPDWEEDFCILKKTLCPAVLTENFFQDNRENVDYLLSAEGKADITEVHVKGIISYISKL